MLLTNVNIVVLEYINDLISDTDTWRGITGRNILYDTLLLNICASHGLSIMNTMQGGQSNDIGRNANKQIRKWREGGKHWSNIISRQLLQS